MGSLFDGIGGFVLAGNQVGIDTLWSSEIDPCCEAVTKYHFPDVAQLGDITKIDGAKVPPVDIRCGGSPCQDLSVAGKRAGLAGERSGLYMEQIRIIREMRAATNNTYPRYMVWENVPGALSSNKGEDFRAVLEEAARCADKAVSIPESKKWSNAGCIVGDGWSIAWRILDAQFWGVPQRRRRIFLVADLGGERAGEVLFKPESMLWHSAKSGEAREGIAADAEGSTGRSSYGVTTKGNGDAFISQERHTSLSVGGGQAGQGYPCILQEYECCASAFTNRGYDAGDKTETLRAESHGAIPMVVERKDQVWPEKVGSILARADSSPCIDRGQPFVVFTQNQREEVRDLNGVTAFLAAESGMRQTNYICEPIGVFMAGQGAKARTIGYSEDAAPTLKSTNSGGNTVPSVVFGVDCRNASLDAETTHTLQAKPGGGFSLNCTPSVCYASTGYGSFIEARPTLGASAEIGRWIRSVDYGNRAG
jgi:DNA (cytosine-5)-methyltransferase 1